MPVYHNLFLWMHLGISSTYWTMQWNSLSTWNGIRTRIEQDGMGPQSIKWTQKKCNVLKTHESNSSNMKLFHFYAFDKTSFQPEPIWNRLEWAFDDYSSLWGKMTHESNILEIASMLFCRFLIHFPHQNVFLATNRLEWLVLMHQAMPRYSGYREKSK